MRVFVLKKFNGVEYFEMKNASFYCVISGFRCEIGEKCALLGCYEASSGNSLPTFRDKLSVPSSRTKNPKRKIFLKRQ